MSTKIQWSQDTWNPVLGCSKVSSGCSACYAVRQVHRMAGNPNPTIRAANEGLTAYHRNGQLDWTGVVRLIPSRLTIPLRWRAPRRVFVNSLSDLFHPGLTDEEIARVFGVMAATPEHTYQILTKRPERMASLLGTERFFDLVEMEASHYTHTLPEEWPLPNCWLGTSVEDQDAADQRIPHLLDTPAAIRFLSLEPLLGPVDLDEYLWESKRSAGSWEDVAIRGLSWLIIGGESGPGARPLQGDWISSLIEQGREAGSAVFCKQTGTAWAKAHGYQDRKGGDMAEWPTGWRVREYPATKGGA